MIIIVLLGSSVPYAAVKEDALNRIRTQVQYWSHDKVVTADGYYIGDVHLGVYNELNETETNPLF